MTAQPHWSPVDSNTADLLSLVAVGTPATPTADEEWELWLFAARTVARENDGLVDPNKLRPLVRDVVAPRRRSAFVNRALSLNLMKPAGWVVSDDHAGRNGGKPSRCYRWLGGAA